MLDAAVRANLDHLRPWMPWVRHEPESIERRTVRLRRFRRRFEAGADYTYGIFDRDEREVLGGAGLHLRIGAGAAEIGYWIHVDRVREGLATAWTNRARQVPLPIGFDPTIVVPNMQALADHLRESNK